MAIWMLERTRASDAWAAVAEIRALPDTVQARFRSQVRSGPAMIQRNGLGQFFAFLAAKGFENGNQLRPQTIPNRDRPNPDRANGLLYQHAGRWLVQALRLQPNAPAREAVVPGANAQTDPLAFLLDPNCGLQQTMHATREVLAWLQWARRFAESQLTTAPDTEDNAEHAH